MKKLLVLIMALALVLGLAACGEKEEVVETFELALITDVGTIDDKSFNQSAWEGLEAYAKDAGLTYKYYQPTEKSDDAYLAAIALAVEGGAKFVVCPGSLFEVSVGQAQTLYPDVKFVMLDVTLAEIQPNLLTVLFADQESGYAAGYAAVKGGYTKLGFMGGMAVPAVMRYGYGFVAGADAAAKELGIDVEMKYHYTGTFSESPEILTLAGAWYADGTEVIFSCGGGIVTSILAAADAAEKDVIGVDTDQSGLSDRVVTSAVKHLSSTVYAAAEAYHKGAWEGGYCKQVTAANGAGTGLPMASTKIEGFTQEMYDALYAELIAGTIAIPVDTDYASAADIPVTNTTLTVVE
ncbi:MAG: BMP family ABC transporter substrate-binding protein [Firmicutes bacterium]|nr:BMP family ABC transporter substrate-binding protein [Bacillota bacterium]